jgi:hypothetical protein
MSNVTLHPILGTLLLVATWKALAVPMLIFSGIGGCVARGLVDMMQNFETGYGPGSRKAKRQAISIFVLFLLIAICVGVFGCAHKDATIAPQIVHSTQASYSGNEQNSGMPVAPKVGEQGFQVNQDWIDAYDALLAKFGGRLFPPRKSGDRDGIAKEDGAGYYRITDAVLERYDNMNAIRRDEEKRKRSGNEKL